jgi:hypothetical protein
MKNKLFIGIDPAFREGGFSICIIDMSDKTARFKTFKNGFLDFSSWFLYDSPDVALVCVENSNLTNRTFWTHRNSKTGALMTSNQAKYNKAARPLNAYEAAKVSRDVGKNQATSQNVVDLCRTKYNTINCSPLQKGGKWTKQAIAAGVLRSEGLTSDKKRMNQDDRDAFKLALIALKRRFKPLPPLGAFEPKNK